MKILWIARGCPLPATDGEKLRAFQLLRVLAQRHDVTLVCRVVNAEEEAGLAELNRLCTGGAHGVFIPPPGSMGKRLRWLLPFVFSRYPISLCTVFFPAIRDRLRTIAREQRFDIVQIDNSSLTIYLDHVRFQANPALLLSLHNIDSVRNERVLEHTPFGLAKLYRLLDQRRFKRWEIESLARYDMVMAMSEVDKRILLAELPELPVAVVPNGVDCRGIAFAPAAHPAKSLLLVSSFGSEANRDAAMYFLDAIFPLVVRRHPDATLTIVGREPHPELLARHDGRRVIVTGTVPDVMPYYRTAAVAVAPLRSGGGTRLKILEAMAAGVPVVSTTVGAEGLNVVAGEHLLVADQPEGFASAIDRLLIDASLRAAVSERARKLVETLYDWALIAERHDEVYRSLAASRKS